MPKNYDISNFLEGVDVTNLLDHYHQAHLETYQSEHPEYILPQLDKRFWQNKDGELIFYAGESTIYDNAQEKTNQSLGKNLYHANLEMVKSLLRLNISELPSDNIHIMALLNWHKQHWTSVVLTLKDLNKEKYAEIYKGYQDFKVWLKRTHPDFKLVAERTTVNYYVQYATGNRHGVVAKNKQDEETLVCVYFKSIGKEHLLKIDALFTEQNGEQTPNIEGDLKLILEPKNLENSFLCHFDSLQSEDRNASIKNYADRFLASNKLDPMFATVSQQMGNTCGEHAILNALKYVFFGLTNTVPSKDLRTASNYFCSEFAQLFLFDFNPSTYKDSFELILNHQKLIAVNASSMGPELSVSEETVKNPSRSAGELMATGVLVGAGITLLSINLVAPMLGLVTPLSMGLFTAAVGFVSAAMAYVITEQPEEIAQSFTINGEKTSAPEVECEETARLMAESLRVGALEEASRKTNQNEPAADLPVPSKIFTPGANTAAKPDAPKPDAPKPDADKAELAKKAKT